MDTSSGSIHDASHTRLHFGRTTAPCARRYRCSARHAIGNQYRGYSPSFPNSSPPQLTRNRSTQFSTSSIAGYPSRQRLHTISPL
ncbi:hypothetical protein OG21DRAFT_1507275, partial [Imleria badia]